MAPIIHHYLFLALLATLRVAANPTQPTYFARTDGEVGSLGMPDNVDVVASDECTKTIYTVPHFVLGPTSIVWTTTTTSTDFIDCGNCHTVTAIPRGGHGPAARFTTTVTAEEPYTTKEVQCGV